MSALSSCRPPERTGDLERVKWSIVPEELHGKAITPDKLGEGFPEEPGMSGVVLLGERRACKVFGLKRADGLKYPLAYECSKCHQLRMGPPEISDEELSESSTGFYAATCRSCGDVLYDNTSN